MITGDFHAMNMPKHELPSDDYFAEEAQPTTRSEEPSRDEIVAELEKDYDALSEPRNSQGLSGNFRSPMGH